MAVPLRDKQFSNCTAIGIEGNVVQPMRPKSIGKRPKESSRVRGNSVEIVDKVEKLKEKVDNLEYVVGLVYKMLKAKELGFRIEEVKIPTRLVEAR